MPQSHMVGEHNSCFSARGRRSSHLSETVVIHFLQGDSLDRVSKTPMQRFWLCIHTHSPEPEVWAVAALGQHLPKQKSGGPDWCVGTQGEERSWSSGTDEKESVGRHYYAFWNAIQRMRTANCNRRCQVDTKEQITSLGYQRRFVLAQSSTQKDSAMSCIDTFNPSSKASGTRLASS
jgi:hypothetical protein